MNTHVITIISLTRTQVSSVTLPPRQEFSSGVASHPGYQGASIHIQSGRGTLRHWDDDETVELEVVEGTTYQVPQTRAFLLVAGETGLSIVLVGDIGGHLVNPTLLRLNGNNLEVGSGAAGREVGALIQELCGDLVVPSSASSPTVFWVPAPRLDRVLPVLANHFRLVSE